MRIFILLIVLVILFHELIIAFVWPSDDFWGAFGIQLVQNRRNYELRSFDYLFIYLWFKFIIYDQALYLRSLSIKASSLEIILLRRFIIPQVHVVDVVELSRSLLFHILILCFLDLLFVAILDISLALQGGRSAQHGRLGWILSNVQKVLIFSSILVLIRDRTAIQ